MTPLLLKQSISEIQKLSLKINRAGLYVDQHSLFPLSNSFCDNILCIQSNVASNAQFRFWIEHSDKILNQLIVSIGVSIKLWACDSSLLRFSNF